MYHLYLQLPPVGQKVGQLFHTQTDPGASFGCGIQPLDEGDPKTQRSPFSPGRLGSALVLYGCQIHYRPHPRRHDDEHKDRDPSNH